MTYFGFLLRYVVIPILILLGLLWWSQRNGRSLPQTLRGTPAGITLLAHVLVAIIYTTPWDNYLVATGVWWYDPELVTGIVLGWVPLEEYTFFILQSVLSGLWLLLLARYLPLGPSGDYARPSLRRWSVTAVAILWLISVSLPLLIGRNANYLALELGWALLPMAVQLAFGADILWRYRRLVALGIAVPTLYLSFMDSLAISAGTWTIDPAQSLNIYLGGVLPVEEFVFFLITNVMLVFGMTLVLAQESQARLHEELVPWAQRRLRRGQKLVG